MGWNTVIYMNLPVSERCAECHFLLRMLLLVSLIPNGVSILCC